MYEHPQLFNKTEQLKKEFPHKVEETKPTYQMPINEKLPFRFKNPGSWKYENRAEHPLYTTTSNGYGFFHPSLVEMPKKFHSKDKYFSEQTTPYRNHSLNTSLHSLVKKK